VSEDDVLFGHRLQLVDLAGRIGVTAACRTFGVHRSTDYARKARSSARPWARCAHASAAGRGCLSPLLEQRIVAFALGHPGLGPRRCVGSSWHWRERAGHRGGFAATSSA
jgi:hypothetical protein